MTQITKIRNVKKNITTIYTKLKMIIKEYCEKLSSNKLRNPR